MLKVIHTRGKNKAPRTKLGRRGMQFSHRVTVEQRLPGGRRELWAWLEAQRSKWDHGRHSGATARRPSSYCREAQERKEDKIKVRWNFRGQTATGSLFRPPYTNDASAVEPWITCRSWWRPGTLSAGSAHTQNTALTSEVNTSPHSSLDP